MSDTGTNRSAPPRPLDAVLMGLVALSLAGGGLLLSAPESTELMEGAKPWHAGSLLRAVVQLLCLNYAFPTINPGTVKMYVLGISAGLALISIGIALLVGARGQPEAPGPSQQSAEGGHPASGRGVGYAADLPIERGIEPDRSHRDVSPLVAAQALIGLFLLWSFASARWSSAPELSVGGTVLLTIQFLWTFALAFGLRARSAVWMTRAAVGVSGVIAALAIWYYYGRNPGLRAMFPFGNPIFLATCLIPGMLLSLTWLLQHALMVRGQLQSRQILVMVGIVAVHLLAGWAFFLADSRGPALGLLFGLLAIVFFVARGKWRWVPLLTAIGITVCLGLFFDSTKDAYSATGRSATIRQREYAWSYAWRMFVERPFTGQGQGAFVLKGDSYAVQDVLADPLVFENRISHVHNEWLEVLADLGAVGVVLLLGGLLITLRAAMRAIDSSREPQRQWSLIGVAAALVGIMVTETFSVGLRVSGVPTFFFGLLGLCWCLSRTAGGTVVDKLSATKSRRMLYGTIATATGLAVLLVSHADWSASRAEYDTGVAFAEGRIDDAIANAGRSIVRLNPQRALRGLSRLGETHMRQALRLQNQAADRERRAVATEPPSVRLMILARDDYEQSEQHCIAATHALKELVSRSPGFIGSGLLEYQISLARAANVDARIRLADVPGGVPLTDKEVDALAKAREQFAQNAWLSLEREMRRQPFSATVAIEYARSAAGAVSFSLIFDALARPLRYSRITRDYVDVMGYLLSDPRNEEHADHLLEEAVRALTVAVPLDDAGEPIEMWAPEKLRLDGMVRFLRGDYEGAVSSLEIALTGYEVLTTHAALATASCYGELADAVFYVHPLETDRSVSLARTAIERAPGGRLGKELVSGIERRLVDYHLAGGREQDARELISTAAPSGASDQAARFELAVRYRRLCESMLTRRGDLSLANPPEAAMFAGPPAPEPNSYIAPDLLAAMMQWIDRAIELEPKDPDIRRVAAAIALERGDVAGAVDQIIAGIEHGLSEQVVEAFIEAASARYPDSPAIQRLIAEHSADQTASTPP